MPDGASFCPKCGESTSPNQVNDDLNTILDSAFFSPTQKVILKPDEQTPKKEVEDSSKTMAGSSKSLGTVLIILGIKKAKSISTSSSSVLVYHLSALWTSIFDAV